MPRSATETSQTEHLESEVRRRYAAAAQAVEAELCCPTTPHDPDLLALLPREIVETDYGCGDPSAWVEAGETVLDLCSGSGKACYVMAQKVDAEGRVYGLDVNDEMLALARRHQDGMAERLGYANVSFHKARIEDMALDLDVADAWLAEHPLRPSEDVSAYETHCAALRRSQPVVADGSVDVIVSNRVLNLVRPEEKAQLFREMYRVLGEGGRAVISDIVCDEDPTPAILADPTLWSGCISGVYREDAFLEAFAEAGFHGIELVARAEEPWQIIDGIEYRSVTVRAFKGSAEPCLERNQALIYRGPWSQVSDDEGHAFVRGQRTAVCSKTFRLLTNPRGPFGKDTFRVPPREEVPHQEALPYARRASPIRSPQETKGADYHATRTSDGPSCSTDANECC